MKESEFVPSVDLLVAYNRWTPPKSSNMQVNGLMEVGDTDPTNNGFAIRRDGYHRRGGQLDRGAAGSNNGNLVFGADAEFRHRLSPGTP